MSKFMTSQNETNETDPYNVFLELRKLFPNAFFLQTHSNFTQPNSSTKPLFSIIGLEAEEILTIRGGQAELIKGSDKTLLTGSALDELNRRLQFYTNAKDSKLPYEEGGSFGVIGYDLVREIEPSLKKMGYFSKLQNSTAVEAEIVFVKNLVVFDHKNKQTHLILKSKKGHGSRFKTQIINLLNRYAYVDQNQGSETLLQNKKDQAHELFRLRTLLLEDLSMINRISIVKTLKNKLKLSFGYEAFKNAVDRIKKHIIEGDIFQAVLAEQMEYELNGITAIEIFTKLREINSSAYSFYFPFQKSEFFGASPETLVKVKNKKIETHPIAGTGPRGKNRAEDLIYESKLLASQKEAAEHLMLVDLARNDIGRVAIPGTVEVNEYRQVLRLTNVMHLSSIVTGQLNSKHQDFDVFKSCFPAGTLSGAPKIRAMEILSQLELQPRGFYGGAMVAFDFNGGFDSCIAIRGIEVVKNKAILRAGAGIVADSDSLSEYQEIHHKIVSLLQAIALCELKSIKYEKAKVRAYL